MEKNIVPLTTDQLKELLAAVKVYISTAESGAGKNVKASLSNCPAYFSGQRDHEAVEEFVDAITTYKEVEGIKDEDAFKGISLLFRGIASTWWQGVRKEAKSWDDVIRLIREHFAPKKPSYQIYMELFSKFQDEMCPIHTFVCQKRALLAQLPEGRHNEETEIDLIFGQIHIKYRKYIHRDDVKTFMDLLKKGQLIEQNHSEYQQTDQPNAKATKRCSHCKMRGHTTNECRKLKQAQEGAEASRSKPPDQ